MGLHTSQASADFSLTAPVLKYFVDLDNGNDGTAVAGDPSKPWLTIQAAIDQVVTDAVKGLVIIQQYTGNYSSENFTIKGDCSLTVEHFMKLPKLITRTWDNAVPNQWDYFGGGDDMFPYYGTSKRLQLGTFTLDSTWTSGNFCEGFNCSTMTINNDLTDNTATFGYGGFILRHITSTSIVRGTATIIDGNWYHVWSSGDFLDHPGVAGTKINGFFAHCVAKSQFCNAETVNGTFMWCVAQSSSFGHTDDFAGYAAHCITLSTSGFGSGSGGVMSGVLYDCKALAGGIASGGAVSGKIIDCNVVAGGICNLGGNMSGYIQGTRMNQAGYSPYITGTVRDSEISISGNTTSITGSVYNCTITIDADRTIGGTGRNTTGGMRDCTVIHGTGGSTVPVLVQGATSAALAFNIINCTFITDQAHAIAGNAAGQYLIAYNNVSDASTAVIDNTNFAAGANIESANNNLVATNTLKI